MNWPALLPVAIAAGFVAANGGRAQMLVARLANDLGRSNGLLLSALVTSSLTMALAAWIGSEARAQLTQGMLGWFAAAALLGASAGLLWPIRMRVAKEPTRSLGAISLVLFARQLFDAPRLLILAAATQLGPANVLGLGGSVGAGLCLWFGWRFGDVVDRRFAANAVRWTMGLVLLVVAGLLIAEAANLYISN